MKKPPYSIEKNYKGLDYGVYPERTDVGNQIAEGRELFIGANFLKLFQPENPDIEESIRYIHLEEKGKPIALASTAIYQVEIPKIKQRIGIALVGNPYVAADSGILFANPEIEKQYKTKVLHSIKDAIRRLGAHLLVIRETQLDKDSLQKSGFFEFPSEPILELPLQDFNSIKDYNGAMRANYRRPLSKSAKTLKENNLSWGVPDVSEYPTLDRLHFNVDNRAPVMHSGVPFSERMRQLIANAPRLLGSEGTHQEMISPLMKICGQKADIYALQNNEKQSKAFAFNTTEGKISWSSFVGMEYNEKTADIYRALLYKQIEMAINRGSDKIIFGRTGLETKQKLGAKISPLRSVGSVLRPFPFSYFVNKSIAPIASSLMPPNENPYTVFKND